MNEAGKTRTSMVSLRVPGPEYARLRRIADERNVSVSWLIRESARFYFEAIERLRDLEAASGD